MRRAGRCPRDALEEGEPDGIGRLGLVKRGDGLDDDVGVAEDDASVVDLCRSGVVVALRIREEAELHDRGAIGKVNNNAHTVFCCASACS